MRVWSPGLYTITRYLFLLPAIQRRSKRFRGQRSARQFGKLRVNPIATKAGDLGITVVVCLLLLRQEVTCQGQ